MVDIFTYLFTFYVLSLFFKLVSLTFTKCSPSVTVINIFSYQFPLAHMLLNIRHPSRLRSTSGSCCSITLPILQHPAVSSHIHRYHFSILSRITKVKGFTLCLLASSTFTTLSARDTPAMYRSMYLSQLYRASPSFFVMLQAPTPYNRTGPTC